MDDRIEAGELTRLLAATGRAHHKAFEGSDGFDPDWAMWYSGHLQALVGERLGSFPSRGELVYLLVSAERAYATAGNDRGSWPESYAAYILANFRGG